MLSKSSRLYAALALLATGPILAYFPSIIWSALYFIGGIVVLCALAWCIFHTLDMLNALNIQWAASRKDLESAEAFKAQQNKSRAATYPASYPSGWYPLCWSHEVKKGQVIACNALGKTYAVFRGDKNGEVGVLDSHCPHLGSSLVVGGTVCDDTIVCPFHKWKFDKAGVCRDIPYLARGKIPAMANTTSYPCVEYHGMVCVHFGGAVPAYHLPVQHDLLTDEYRFVSSMDYGMINMHIKEFAENAGDWAHFAPVHGRMMIPFTQIEIPLLHRWLTIEHVPNIHVGGTSAKDSRIIKHKGYGPDAAQFMYFINDSHLKWKGASIPNSSGHACITFCGPAGVCIFKFSIPAMDPDAHIYLFHTHLPRDEMNLRVRFHWFASKKLPRLLVWYVVGNWIAQWTNDIAIWENKVFLKKPCLVAGDGPMFKVRRWWRQFYPLGEDAEHKDRKVVIGQQGDEVAVEQEEEERSKEDDPKANKDGIAW